MRMWVLNAQLAIATIAPTTGAIATSATTTTVTIGIVAMIGQKDPSLVNITAADQTTSSLPLMNLAVYTKNW